MARSTSAVCGVPHTAEVERAIIVERVNAGIARTKAEWNEVRQRDRASYAQDQKAGRSARGTRGGSEHPRGGVGGKHQRGVGGSA